MSSRLNSKRLLINVATSSDDALLVKIAVFGIAVSFMATLMVSVVYLDQGDYDYDQIQSYREELSGFTGESMLNTTPWVLTHVFTPWISTDGTTGHIDDDGWLYGEEITDYSYIKKSADIKLSPDQKSSVPITFTDDAVTYQVQSGYKWWARESGTASGYVLAPVTWLTDTLFPGALQKTTTETKSANSWNYTGYRYVFDPTLPFQDSSDLKTSVRDGALSLVWYAYNGHEGLSGGLDVYGGQVLLASYSATDIIAAYNTASGYATTYDFNFEGTMLKLSVRFDQDAIESGTTLMQAWTEGSWSMAISSISAGNFYDIDGSTSFVSTAGSMIQTFIKIFTFNMPELGNPLANWILWAIVGLPMTIAMLCVTLRLISSFKVL